jgi:DNA polymerase V
MNKTAIPLIDKNKYLKESLLPEDFSEKDLNQSNKTFIPLFGFKVSCGLFGISDDFIEKYQSLDNRFIKNKESTFFFQSDGHSMEPTIFPDDILIVDRSIEPWDRRVCIVCYEGNLICKRVFKEKDHVVLYSDNLKFKAIKVYNPENLRHWGVVIARASEIF